MQAGRVWRDSKQALSVKKSGSVFFLAGFELLIKNYFFFFFLEFLAESLFSPKRISLRFMLL